MDLDSPRGHSKHSQDLVDETRIIAHSDLIFHRSVCHGDPQTADGLCDPRVCLLSMRSLRSCSKLRFAVNLGEYTREYRGEPERYQCPNLLWIVMICGPKMSSGKK